MSSISIVIPCLNEEKYIESCLESIIASDISNFELILVDGGSSDNTIEIISNYQKRYSCIKLLHNPKKFTPVSMNIGIKASSGDYIFIISAHAKYQLNYFSKLTEHCKELKADCVGGILVTDVKNRNQKSNSIKEILTHPFGVGNASFRTGVETITEVDTVAFGCYNKNSFSKYGLFDERLIRNQDIELNKRIINGGGKIYLVPDIEATYYARENFNELSKNNFANGKWNILTSYYTKTLNSLSLRHFIPLIFVLSIILPLFFSIININFLWIGALSLSSYLALVIMLSLKLRENSNNFFYLVSSFLILHLSYGLGSLIGIFSIVKKRYKKVKND
jgi:glycosyltransferase involved in cell wall biosynthesis